MCDGCREATARVMQTIAAFTENRLPIVEQDVSPMGTK